MLDDPYPDPTELEQHIPEISPEPEFEKGGRLEEDWALNQDTRPAEEIEQEGRRAGVGRGVLGDSSTSRGAIAPRQVPSAFSGAQNT